MILSASRRTDLPAFYSQWLRNRLREGQVVVRNPWNPRQVSRLLFSPETVDGIVFWTKNPAPMLPWISELKDYVYYFQYTLNPYEETAEPHLPRLTERVETMRALAGRIGRRRVVWRYDPVMLSARWTVEWHLERFSELAERLKDSAGSVTVSFLDQYRHIRKRVQPLGLWEIGREEMERLGAGFAEIGRKAGLPVATCAEEIELSAYGIGHASCISRPLLEELGGFRLTVSRDRNQRKACGCAASVDIGAYRTCPGGCLYCYANAGNGDTAPAWERHDPLSPLQCGALGAGDAVKEKQLVSQRERGRR